MISIFDFLRIMKSDFDFVDTTLDASVTCCYIDADEYEETDWYEMFCNEIIKKVEVCEAITDCMVSAKWYEFIKHNKDAFETFMQTHWGIWYSPTKYFDEFAYQWINEIHNYMAGNVPDDFYKTLYEFAVTLT